MASYLSLRGILVGFGTSLASLPGVTHGLGQRLLQIPQIPATYLGLFIVPFQLTIGREAMLMPVHAVWEPAVLLPTALLLGLGGLTWWLARRSPLAFFGGLWCGLAILPVSSLVPQYLLIAEHYLYLPMIGLATLEVAGIVFLTDRLARWHPGLLVRRHALALLVLVLIVYGARTVARNRDWADDVALYRATVAAIPNSLSARYSLGRLLAQQHQFASAEEQFATALQLDPTSKAIQLQLASVWAQQGKVEQAEAAYRRLLERDPTYVPAYLRLGLLAHKQGRPAEAIVLFQQALKLKPEDVASRNALGLVYLQQGQVDAAIVEFQHALENAPQDSSVRSNLATAYLRQGRVQEGIAELEQAVTLEPGNAALQHNLGLAYQRGGLPDLAAAAFRRSGSSSSDDR